MAMRFGSSLLNNSILKLPTCKYWFDPDIVAAEIVEDLQAVLAQFAQIAADLKR